VTTLTFTPTHSTDDNCPPLERAMRLHAATDASLTVTLDALLRVVDYHAADLAQIRRVLAELRDIHQQKTQWAEHVLKA
jgi:hypothetical protein